MTEENKRPTWDEYFMEVMEAISKRATCNRGKSGCVIVKDFQILATGYVGSPIGLPHCDDVGHQLTKTIHEDGSLTQHCVRTVHAEQNAICQAAKKGVSLTGATLYCRMTPCRVCAMLIINCGIKRVICQKKYHAGLESEDMFLLAGIELIFISNESQEYEVAPIESKEKAKDELIKILHSQVEDLVMMSKIELGDDVIQEIKRLNKIINT